MKRTVLLLPVAGVLFLAAIALHRANAPRRSVTGKKSATPGASVADRERDTSPGRNYYTSVRRRRAEQPPTKKAATQALHTTQVRSLVNNLRLCVLRGDERTKRALIQGLRKYPSEARQVLKSELSREGDSRVRRAFSEAARKIE